MIKWMETSLKNDETNVFPNDGEMKKDVKFHAYMNNCHSAFANTQMKACLDIVQAAEVRKQKSKGAKQDKKCNPKEFYHIWEVDVCRSL